LWLMLEEVARRDLLQELQLAAQSASVHLSRPFLKSSTRESLVDHAQRLNQSLRQLQQPWNPEVWKTPDDRRSDRIQSMSKRWKEIWGDPKTPETQEAISRTVAFLRSKQRRKKT